jgi:hypothetical protein
VLEKRQPQHHLGGLHTSPAAPIQSSETSCTASAIKPAAKGLCGCRTSIAAAPSGLRLGRVRPQQLLIQLGSLFESPPELPVILQPQARLEHDFGICRVRSPEEPTLGTELGWPSRGAQPRPYRASAQAGRRARWRPMPAEGRGGGRGRPAPTHPVQLVNHFLK